MFTLQTSFKPILLKGEGGSKVTVNLRRKIIKTFVPGIDSTSQCSLAGRYTVKKAVELLDAPSKNTFLKSNKYNSKVEKVYLDTHVFFSQLCYRMRNFDIREVQ